MNAIRGLLNGVGVLTVATATGFFLVWMAVNVTLGCSNWERDPNCVSMSEILP